MARIKHIALSTDDPAKTAEFYKKTFGLTELRREPAGAALIAQNSERPGYARCPTRYRPCGLRS